MTPPGGWAAAEETYDGLAALRPIGGVVALLILFDVVGQYLLAIPSPAPGDRLWRVTALPILISQLAPLVMVAAVAGFAARRHRAGLGLVGLYCVVVAGLFILATAMLLQDAPLVIRDALVPNVERFQQTARASLLAGALGGIAFLGGAVGVGWALRGLPPASGEGGGGK